MSLLHRVFVLDWRRKLLALLLAFALWWYVDGLLAHDRVLSLRVVAVQERVTPEFGTLALRVPPGWTLVEPREGASVQVWLHGSRAVLDHFTGRQFAAYYEVNAVANGRLGSELTASVRPEDFEWLRQEEARQVLAGVSELQGLEIRLERVLKRTLPLGHHLLNLRGAAAPEYEAMPWDARFELTQAELSGPQRVVEEAFAEHERAAADLDLPASLFEPVQLEPSVRRDESVALRLAASWYERGLRLEPSWVRVTIPVRQRAHRGHEWMPTLHALQSEPPRWQVPAYAAPWRATLRYEALPPGVDFRAWIEEHVVLMLPLARLATEGLQEREVELEWTLVGISDPLERASILDALLIEPVDPDNARLTVARLPQ